MTVRSEGRALFLSLLAATCTMLAMPASASAQDNHDFQTWSAALGTADLAPGKAPVKLWFDGHVRRGDPGTTVIVRPALGYAFAPWVSVWAGYAWVPVMSDITGERLNEHRAWQQVILKSDWLDGRLNGQLRTRFEQRFHDSSDTTGFRLRQFARLDYRHDLESRWSVVVWDELFWGLNDAGFAQQGYDQNRIFVGPALHTFDGLRVEFGYLWANLERGGQRQNQHALAVNFFVSF